MPSFHDKTSYVAVASLNTNEINKYVDGWLKGKGDDSIQVNVYY